DLPRARRNAALRLHVADVVENRLLFFGEHRTCSNEHMFERTATASVWQATVSFRSTKYLPANHPHIPHAAARYVSGTLLTNPSHHSPVLRRRSRMPLIRRTSRARRINTIACFRLTFPMLRIHPAQIFPRVAFVMRQSRIGLVSKLVPSCAK